MSNYSFLSVVLKKETNHQLDGLHLMEQIFQEVKISIKKNTLNFLKK